MVDGPTIPELTDEAVGNLRQMMATQAPVLGDPATHGLTRSEIHVPLDGETSVRCLLYKPTTASQDLRPGYVHIHGGGYLFGTPDGSDASNLQVAGRLGATVLHGVVAAVVRGITGVGRTGDAVVTERE